MAISSLYHEGKSLQFSQEAGSKSRTTAGLHLGAANTIKTMPDNENIPPEKNGAAQSHREYCGCKEHVFGIFHTRFEVHTYGVSE
jgi:hypothetical protein